MTTSEQLSRYRRANPWTILNLQSSSALCGRFPSREAAEEHAAGYRGGVVGVNETTREVYVSEVPSL